MSELKRLPIATLCLIVVSIAAAFAAFLSPDLIESFGFRADDPRALAGIACIFLHANLVHLLGNMVFLAAVGPAVEFAVGSLRFLATFFVGGICGVLVHWIFSANQPEPSVLVGGSGAIAACVAFFSVRYITMRVPLAPNLSAPIWAIALVWVALQAVGAFVRIGEPGGVAFWSHLGGFGAGVAMSLFFQAPKLATIQFGHDVLDQMNARSPAAALAAAENHLKSHPSDVRAWRTVAEVQRQLGHAEQEREALAEWLRHSGDRPHDPLNRIMELGIDAGLTPLVRTRYAELVSRDHPGLARRLLESVVAMSDDEPQKPDAMLALAELDRSANLEQSKAVLAELAERFPFHAATEIARAKGWLG